MTRIRTLACIALLLAPALSHAQHATAPTPTFTITAPNVTMPSSGAATIAFTLTSVNAFAGQLAVGCTPPTVAANVRLPFIDLGGPVFSFFLTANSTTSGTITLLAIKPAVLPVRYNLPPRRRHSRSLTWSLAGALLLGLGPRKKKAFAARLSLVLCLLLALTGFTACGGGPTLTAGTYTYTLTADQLNVPALPLVETTTLTVTIPPGIPTNN
ncbi:MAG: hypothetical protein WBY53_03205 [Acidobacteriaceae bacterium]